jgi:hypothetical protein
LPGGGLTFFAELCDLFERIAENVSTPPPEAVASSDARYSLIAATVMTPPGKPGASLLFSQLLKVGENERLRFRWLEGTWRGTGEGVQPFFERYRFEKDSTLAIDGFENEKLEKVTDTTRYELKMGNLEAAMKAFGGSRAKSTINQ